MKTLISNSGITLAEVKDPTPIVLVENCFVDALADHIAELKYDLVVDFLLRLKMNDDGSATLDKSYIDELQTRLNDKTGKYEQDEAEVNRREAGEVIKVINARLIELNKRNVTLKLSVI